MGYKPSSGLAGSKGSSVFNFVNSQCYRALKVNLNKEIPSSEYREGEKFPRRKMSFIGADNGMVIGGYVGGGDGRGYGRVIVMKKYNKNN